jgi:hypothetical protein
LPYLWLFKDIKIKINRTIIWLVFYVGVKLSLSLSEERRQRNFVNKVLRKILQPKREDSLHRWLNNEELPHSCSSRILFEGKNQGGWDWRRVACVGEKGKA